MDKSTKYGLITFVISFVFISGALLWTRWHILHRLYTDMLFESIISIIIIIGISYYVAMFPYIEYAVKEGKIK